LGGTQQEEGNMSNENQALTPIQRAAKQLGSADYEPKLIALVEAYRDITAITSPDGLRQVHAARMALKTTRVEIEKRGKEAREDANAYSAAVIAEQKRLVGKIKPEEDRLQAVQDAYEAKIEAEKQAKIEAERLRLERLAGMVADIRTKATCGYSSAGAVEDAIGDLAAMEIGEEFEEFRERAVLARAETIQRMQTLCTEMLEREEAEAERKAAQEAEAKRLADLAAELAERQREQDRIEAERRAKFEAEQAAARAAQAEADAKAVAEREARDAEQRRLQAEADAAAEQRRQAEEAAHRERMRIEQEAAAKEAERLRVERERIEAEREAQERQQRQAEIDSATLIDAATEAHALLTDLAPRHVVTAKLGAALSREGGRAKRGSKAA